MPLFPRQAVPSLFVTVALLATACGSDSGGSDSDDGDGGRTPAGEPTVRPPARTPTPGPGGGGGNGGVTPTPTPTPTPTTTPAPLPTTVPVAARTFTCTNLLVTAESARVTTKRDTGEEVIAVYPSGSRVARSRRDATRGRFPVRVRYEDGSLAEGTIAASEVTVECAGERGTEAFLVDAATSLLKKPPVEGERTRSECKLTKGAILAFTALDREIAGGETYLKLTLQSAPAGCDAKEGYVRAADAHFEVVLDPKSELSEAPATVARKPDPGVGPIGTPTPTPTPPPNPEPTVGPRPTPSPTPPRAGPYCFISAGGALVREGEVVFQSDDQDALFERLVELKKEGRCDPTPAACYVDGNYMFIPGSRAYYEWNQDDLLGKYLGFRENGLCEKTAKPCAVENDLVLVEGYRIYRTTNEALRNSKLESLKAKGVCR